MHDTKNSLYISSYEVFIVVKRTSQQNEDTTYALKIASLGVLTTIPATFSRHPFLSFYGPRVRYAGARYYDIVLFFKCKN